MAKITEQAVLEALKQIIDPDLRKDIVTLGFIKDLAIEGGNVSFRIVLTTPACPVKEEMETQANEIVGNLEGVDSVKVTMDAEVPKGRGIANNVAVPGVKNIIAVSSGKGGVGKSTAAVNLAVGLAKIGAKVGILDADIYGPNVPLMLGKQDVFQQHLGLEEAFGVIMMSVGMLVSPDRPMVLRGPMLHGFVRQFLADVEWGELDYLIVDLPPEEDDELCIPALKAGLNFIRLATPTTDDKRLPAVLANTSGFVYYVSITGITGAAAADSKAVGDAVARIKRHTGLPVCVGFGIRTPEAARAIAEKANGAVVGTALVDALRDSLDVQGKATGKTVAAVAELAASLAQGVRGAKQAAE